MYRLINGTSPLVKFVKDSYLCDGRLERFNYGLIRNVELVEGWFELKDSQKEENFRGIVYTDKEDFYLQEIDGSWWKGVRHDRYEFQKTSPRTLSKLVWPIGGFFYPDLDNLTKGLSIRCNKWATALRNIFKPEYIIENGSTWTVGNRFEEIEGDVVYYVNEKYLMVCGDKVYKCRKVGDTYVKTGDNNFSLVGRAVAVAKS